MALRRQNLSPSANLLRNSRLFSLPNPLPRPPVGETTGAGVTKASETATLPYPTHQAIATTKRSLARGDWGLKRPLPSRSYLVQISDPVVRVKHLDTIELVTDFDSAADHVRTQQKWAEMGVPMMKGLSALRQMDLSGPKPTGAFEIRDDVTSYDTDLGLDEAGLYLKNIKESLAKNIGSWKAESRQAHEKRARGDLQRVKRERHEARFAYNNDKKARRALGQPESPELRQKFDEARSNFAEFHNSPPIFEPYAAPVMNVEVHNAKRWQHQGPWIPGLSAEEFLVYINNEVSKHRKSFTRYLAQYARNEIYTSRTKASLADGPPPVDAEEAVSWRKAREKQRANISSENIRAFIKGLRRETINNPLQSRLVTKLILPFLRIPPIRFKATNYSLDASSRDADHHDFDQEAAPLSTHPSAGLGYLRTKSYLVNHPILGPQALPTPISSRVIQPRSTSTSKESFARLGVAGFVGNDQYRTTQFSSASRTNLMATRDVETIDVDTPGGKKIMVQPIFGSVTNDGRIHVKLLRSHGPEVMVARGELEDRPPVREGYTANVLEDLASGTQAKSEQSERARHLNEILERMDRAKQDSGQGVNDEGLL